MGKDHKFKVIEPPPVIASDIDLSTEYQQDLLYVAASRETD